jgi:prepilin-type N-terminal cleavage/methylation domain-containing protein
MARAMLKTLSGVQETPVTKTQIHPFMVVHFNQASKRTAANAFTLVEVLMAVVLLSLVLSGLMYGYVQANRMAEFSSMWLAAQSYASQGAEQARAADWRPREKSAVTGPNTWDELPPTNTPIIGCGTNFILDIPIKGDPSTNDFAFFVTNYVYVTDILTNPYLRQIRSDAVWRFPLTGQVYTNTVILQRAPDQ